MTAQSVLLDQGNIFFRHLTEDSKGRVDTRDSSEDGDDESEESDDIGDDHRSSRPSSEGGKTAQQTGVGHLDLDSYSTHQRYSDGPGGEGLGLDQPGVPPDLATHGANTGNSYCWSNKSQGANSVLSSDCRDTSQPKSQGANSVLSSDCRDTSQPKSQGDNSLLSPDCRDTSQPMSQLHKTPAGPEQTLSTTDTLNDLKDDDVREDSDGVDEDEEDRLPGLARAHLHSSDGEGAAVDKEGVTDPNNKLHPTEESPSKSVTEETHCESDISGQIANPDVMETSDTMDSVRNINVGSLGQLQKLNKNDPAVKRLFVRPRLTTREVKTIRLDPDIKAIVDDFLRTNITGDFTIARVLRENYASFHPWLASQIQTERNAWAVRLRQAMETGEKTRREGLDSASVIIEAGLRLRDLVHTCSNCMFAHPRTTGLQALTKPRRLGNTVAGSNNCCQILKPADSGTVSTNQRYPGDTASSTLQQQQQQHQQHLQQTSTSRYGPDRSKPPGVMSHTDSRAGSILRLNGLAKASLASGVDVSSLNQKLVRLTTLVGKDNMSRGETDTAAAPGHKDTDLTSSPMNVVRVEDADVYNYESDPGVYFPRLKYEKRRVKRGVHEGYLHRRRSNLTYGAAAAVTGCDRSSKNLNGKGTPSYYKTLRNSYDTNKPNKSRSSQWFLNDLETLMEREFGPDSEGNIRENGTEWSGVIRDNLDVLTELCRTLVTERSDCLDILGCQATGDNANLVFALKEHLRVRQEQEERYQEEMEYRHQQLEDENQALQAEVSLLKKKVSSTNENTLTLRHQISRLEAMVSGEQPEVVNKCVGTGDSFLPKPRMLGGTNGTTNNSNSNKNGFNPFSTLHTATLVYAGTGSTNRYAVKATLAKGRRRRVKPLHSFGRATHQYSDVSDSETVDEDVLIRRNTKPRLSLIGKEAELARAEDTASILSTPAVSHTIPQIRLGLASQDKTLVEISEETLQTLKQRANTLEQSLQDALSNMDSSSKTTPRRDTDSRSSVSGTPTSNRSRDHRQTASGRNSARQQLENRPRFWTEASFEVNGSPPPGNRDRDSQAKPRNNHNKDNNNTRTSQDSEKTPRRGPLTVIKRPPDYRHGSNHLPERRAVSETLPFTLEHEKSSLLSGRALPLTSTTPLDKSLTQETPRRKVSPASVASSNSNKDKLKLSDNNNNNSSSSITHKSKENGVNDSRIDNKPTATNSKNKDKLSHHSSFNNNVNSSTSKSLNTNQINRHTVTTKETDGFTSNGNKKATTRLKATRGGGVVAKCLRCQKLFNSVDNHKLACCYHPKEKARFEHYDGSGRLVAVVHAWQCCQQGQDADGCCFGQHV